MGILYSYLFVLIIIGFAMILEKKQLLSDEGSRKFIHIGVGNYMLIAPFVFDNMVYALIPPFTFIILNYLSFRFDIIKAMEREEKNSNNLGTVYYAVSLFVVVLLDYLLFNEFRLSILPILIMTYGDGFSAIIGKHFNSKVLFAGKTLIGLLTMFVISLIISLELISKMVSLGGKLNTFAICSLVEFSAPS